MSAAAAAEALSLGSGATFCSAGCRLTYLEGSFAGKEGNDGRRGRRWVQRPLLFETAEGFGDASRPLIELR